MTLLKTIKSGLKRIFRYSKEISAARAYDLWAADYDAQTGNPLIWLDKQVLDHLITPLNMEGKVIADIGCGTGRHWPMLLSKKPGSIIGCDISKNMLEKLTDKYPAAQTCLTNGVSLAAIPEKSCDIITCNLTIGYLENLPAVFAEWSRILKDKGEMIITDFHPMALVNGGNRVFTHKGKSLFIKNYIHSLDEIRRIAGKHQFGTAALTERKVDERIRHFYEEHNSLNVYNKVYDTPVFYGLHLKRPFDPPP